MDEIEKHAFQVAVEVFHRNCQKLHQHRNPNIFLKGNDELFSDWFTSGLEDLDPRSLGANTHPDYIINEVGFELKSLKGNGQIQFNSTIPCGGFVHGDLHGECYYAIARYDKERHYGYLKDFIILDGDYFNFDREFAFAHANSQETNFGTYGDGVVRHRKMYSFPSPIKTTEGIAFISKFNNASELNSSLYLEKSIDRVEVSGEIRKFYIYRHSSLN